MKKLIMLGTGCAMVTKCYNTCFLVKTSEDEYFMCDAGGGNGIFRQLEAVDVAVKNIHYMFVTHGHTDHILGVIWIIRKIADTMNKGKYEGDFNIYCHDIVKNMLQAMCEMMLKKKDFAQIGKRIFINEIKDGESVEFLDMKLTAFDIMSTKAKQFGFELFLDEENKLTCLGDEPYNEHAEVYAKGAKWLLSEAFCQYKDRDIFKPYEKNHSTVKEAAELAENLRVDNLILYHTEDKNMKERKKNYTAEAKEYFSGNIFVPDDLETINLD